MFKMFIVTGYPFLGFVGVIFMNCIFLDRGFSPVYRRNSVEFSIDFRELGYFRNHLPYSWESRFSFFKRVMVSCLPCEILNEFRETGTQSRSRDGCHVSAFRVEA